MIAVAVVFLLLLHSADCQAEVYACRDSNGSVYFTNIIPEEGCNPFYQEVKSKKRNQKKSYDTVVYDDDIWATGVRYNVDPYLIKAVIRTESAFNHRAVSKKGAQGLMQLMPETARQLGVPDPFNPRQNIDGGTRYLKQLLDTFHGDLRLSIAAYNAGPGAVKRAGGIPKFPETINYVSRVMKHYKGYKTRGKG
ncbi:transglycosylase SLT domain-containing protein [Desulfosediminicola sp.]|uniref:transglycosylase SLT domain-containing protein n=1 Tax=Desulfosediminicola sp. TaxID=2886825 RepID=UPI003AF30183